MHGMTGAGQTCLFEWVGWEGGPQTLKTLREGLPGWARLQTQLSNAHSSRDVWPGRILRLSWPGHGSILFWLRVC